MRPAGGTAYSFLVKNIIGMGADNFGQFLKLWVGHSAETRRPFGWLLATLAMLASLAPAPAAPATTFLRAQGQDIVNERGEKIMLRGVGLGNWMLPEGYMWKFGEQGDRPRRIEKLVEDLIGRESGQRFWTEFRKHYITEADIRRIAELGFNSVRPALNSRLFLSDAGVPTGAEEGFRLLDDLVAWSKQHGVYVIIDLHGAPGGQTGQNIDDSARDLPELFMETKYQDQLVGLWQAIARRYKDEPTVAGYDLLNEPLPERTGAAKTYKARLEPLYQRITKAIREIDSRHMIILEGADWSNDWSVFSAPFDPNLVYQFHYYCWDKPPVVRSIQKFLDYRERFNTPVWVGETGEKDNAFYWATTEYFEANNIGWSFWPWKKMETQNTPYSIPAPTNWAAVTAYSRGGEKPSRELAQQAFDELLANIRLANCVFFPDVVNAMLRRAPGRIEAENYGREGLNRSYSVQETNRLSEHYRQSEPVPILVQTTGRRTDQYATLRAGEWTSYTIRSEALGRYNLTLRVKAETPAQAQVRIGDQVKEVTITTNLWSEMRLGSVALVAGPNSVKCSVTQASADLDWLELEPIKAGQESR
jgi:endoglucanase